MVRPVDTGALGLAAAVMLLLGATAIVGAWALQIFADLPPCPLCLQQRWPYYAALPLLAVALILLGRGRMPRMAATLVALAGLLFLAGAAMGLYHAGIEWGWWPGPTACTLGAGTPLAQDAAGLLRQLETVRVVPCDEAPWRLFGLSLAGYNFLVSLLLALLALGGIRQALRPGT